MGMAFTLLAWFVTAPAGIMIAASSRDTQGAWFKKHMALMGATVGFTLVGFIAVVIGSGGQFADAHAFIGIAIVVLLGVHVGFAIGRPHKDGADNSKRVLWERAHRGLGLLLPTLVAVNFMLGFEKFLLYISVGQVVSRILPYIFLVLLLIVVVAAFGKG